MKSCKVERFPHQIVPSCILWLPSCHTMKTERICILKADLASLQNCASHLLSHKARKSSSSMVCIQRLCLSLTLALHQLIPMKNMFRAFLQCSDSAKKWVLKAAILLTCIGTYGHQMGLHLLNWFV